MSHLDGTLVAWRNLDAGRLRLLHGVDQAGNQIDIDALHVLPKAIEDEIARRMHVPVVPAAEGVADNRPSG